MEELRSMSGQIVERPHSPNKLNVSMLGPSLGSGGSGINVEQDGIWVEGGQAVVRRENAILVGTIILRGKRGG
jgi:hypothetical protein